MISKQGKDPRSAFEATPIYRLLKLVGVPLFRLYFRLRAEGAGRFPASGACILTANHQSYLDPLVLGATCPRPVRFMMLRSFWDRPVIGWFSRKAGSFPVDQGRVATDTLRQALSILHGGGVLGIFPEGRISPDGRLQPARDGVSRFAVKTGAPIVPTAILGTGSAFPKGRLIPMPYRIVVRFGEPLHPNQGAVTSTKDEKRTSEITADLMRRIAELRGETPPY